MSCRCLTCWSGRRRRRWRVRCGGCKWPSMPMSCVPSTRALSDWAPAPRCCVARPWPCWNRASLAGRKSCSPPHRAISSTRCPPKVRSMRGYSRMSLRLLRKTRFPVPSAPGPTTQQSRCRCAGRSRPQVRISNWTTTRPSSTSRCCSRSRTVCRTCCTRWRTTMRSNRSTRWMRRRANGCWKPGTTLACRGTSATPCMACSPRWPPRMPRRSHWMAHSASSVTPSSMHAAMALRQGCCVPA